MEITSSLLRNKLFGSASHLHLSLSLVTERCDLAEREFRKHGFSSWFLSLRKVEKEN